MNLVEIGERVKQEWGINYSISWFSRASQIWIITLAFRYLSSTDKLFTRIYATQLPEGLADKSEKTSSAKKRGKC